MQKDKYN